MACNCTISHELSRKNHTRDDADGGVDEDLYDWEERKDHVPFWQHAVAGSCAGIMEHVAMYPIDVVKTRIQASHSEQRLSAILRDVFRERGALGFMRGAMVIGVGCVPAHAGLFTTYELAKAALLDVDGDEHEPVRAAIVGASSTVVHDSILTPLDVIKQRLQLGKYSGAVDCARSMYQAEGLVPFYRSLPITLATNVPYMGLLVAANESLKRVFLLTGANSTAESSLSGAPLYFLAAGLSGSFAAALTTPFDVVKTRLQTQGISSSSDSAVVLRYEGVLSTMRHIGQEEGAAGFFRGFAPRVALAMPSAAICWGTYETIRMLLSRL
eukprot:TRINITY_DN75917_c0_g1_i1.p1 TRINITY_DN75917_c0_g1~~TRINITY_DN75917_c0_g1_i1.p1  ORF type:complete len:327 (-),score=57.99 TRINITY_DN75917_c0_g1_i1:3-983(-)